ncbi:hypothetical protein SUGI_1424200 [Cryptomeria japonica]|uniref:Uncharacterized protein n=1 Tax=Cryptomeria japonica TaxID=3369 RepID=A0AAD3RQ76_CRYJA|nr:hypothetical protein SUGI_1283890 [Cryptomeria japonica]GLJ57008.1 hypothetical protein SUGI_1283950 [Cryptomeria japonica]GLJ58228.1 hypothetical protein SUGI_1424200 [Cryptomeria japonica]
MAIILIDGKRNVEAVHLRDIVVVLVALGVLGQRGGNGSRDCAAQLAAAVTGLTGSSPARIERAVGSAPESCRLCTRRQINRPCLTPVEFEGMNNNKITETNSSTYATAYKTKSFIHSF